MTDTPHSTKPKTTPERPLRRSVARRWLRPRSISTQLTLLLLGALLLSHIVVTAFLLEDRLRQVEAGNRNLILLRTASILDLIKATPADLHETVLRAASDQRVHFSLDDEPVVNDPPNDRFSRRLVRLIERGLGGDYDVRLTIGGRHVGDRPPPHWHSRDKLHGEKPPGFRPPPHGRPPPQFDPSRRVASMSVGLEDSRWLNVTASLNPAVAIAWPILVSAVLMAVLIVLIVVVMLRRIVRPLEALAHAAERLGRGEKSDPLLESGPSEVVRTTRAFNDMEARLTRFISDRTRLLAAIGHDLRTPITSLRLRAEFIEDEENRTRIVETLDEMSAMIEATLAFARDDAASEISEPVNLSALLVNLSSEFADLGRDVSYSGEDNLLVRCKPVALKRALRNLIENSLRYGGKAVRVRLANTRSGPQIDIEDDGPGIDQDRLGDVFEPFIRLESSRSLETGGVGLGLSIARSIARGQGGDLTLINRTEGTGRVSGLTARLTLPPTSR